METIKECPMCLVSDCEHMFCNTCSYKREIERKRGRKYIDTENCISCVGFRECLISYKNYVEENTRKRKRE